MYKRLQTINPDSEMHTILENNPKDYKSILWRNIDEAKQIYYNIKFLLHVNDIKKPWMTKNELIDECNNKTLSHHISSEWNKNRK